jgi:hypothetical protein
MPLKESSPSDQMEVSHGIENLFSTQSCDLERASLPREEKP